MNPCSITLDYATPWNINKKIYLMTQQLDVFVQDILKGPCRIW